MRTIFQRFINYLKSLLARSTKVSGPVTPLEKQKATNRLNRRYRFARGRYHGTIPYAKAPSID